MKMSDEGFLRPVAQAEVASETDDLIAQVCPGAVVQIDRHDGPFDADWGPIRELATGHACDPEMRYQGSSGGALSALLQYLMESGTVEGVAQTVIDPGDPVANTSQLSRTRDDILRAAGSRYAPSAPLERLFELMETPERLAFVGKPCDVAALRAYARHRPEVAEKFPVVLSFMCGGIPSRKGALAILDKMGVGSEDLSDFRYRGQGWPGKARAVTRSGEVQEMTYAEAWGDFLSSRVQLRCKICPDATGMTADIVCADAWYGDERGYPLFDEADGRSLIIARTELGQNLLEAARSSQFVATQPATVQDVGLMQPYQARRRRLVLSRIAALALIGRIYPRYRGLKLFQAARRSGALAHFRSFAGMLRRSLTKRTALSR
ncbi:Coenzyme F420 hydrogenase/dehydrogenase, beta subunit C-terminal domain [Algihabitans albus]|uniref:Coenzyme F420 hydrogenase/dehydrogenase, beta subunit C-terminal domain n=1 Tax=Algihabitans albus TaxID=2164067 RepID=UPI0013C35C1E|nr:Coenzyme F420 hydrogenase/dehydrogenase, beta subunit C-terminal domain [Algihabitans albus]